jgi:hypothetical protein
MEILMNERIRELARQADAYAWQQIDEGADYDTQPQFFAEKFAELIVRECADVAFLEANSRKTQRAVLQHFGVEE